MHLSGLADAVLADPTLAEALADARGGALPALDLTGPEALRPYVVAGLVREGRTVLAVTATPGLALPDLTLPDRPLVLLAQGVEKPGNLGAMLRTADAAGVGAVLAADPVTDWGNPNVIRASKGTVYAVPVAATDTAQALAWLADRGVAVVATTPDADLLHTDVDYTGPVAVAVGAEKTGLTEAVVEAATHRVRIPMAGHADSLNVATSAAIVLYEAVRQRRRATAAPAPR